MRFEPRFFKINLSINHKITFNHINNAHDCLYLMLIHPNGFKVKTIDMCGL